MSTTTVQRAVASEVSFNIGLMSAQFDIVPARRTNLGKETETHFICPEPHDPLARVSIEYVCDDGHRHKESELVKAYFGADDDGDKITPVTDEDLKLLRCGSLEEKNLDLHVHPVAQVESTMIPDESAYRVRPPRKAGAKQRELYSLLLLMASDPKYALLGELRFRDGRKLYRLRAFRGQLTLQSLIHPNDLAPVDEIDAPELEKAKVAGAKQLLEASVTDFTADAYGFDYKPILDELIARREDAPVCPVVPINAETSDLMATLEASVKKARKKVATPSRTPRKSTARSKKAPAKRATTKAG